MPQLNVQVSTELLEAFQQMCRNQGRMVSEVIRNLMFEALVSGRSYKPTGEPQKKQKSEVMGRPIDDDLTTRGKDAYRFCVKSFRGLRNKYIKTPEKFDQLYGPMFNQVEGAFRDKNWQFLVDFYTKNPIPHGRGYLEKEWDGN